MVFVVNDNLKERLSGVTSSSSTQGDELIIINMENQRKKHAKENELIQYFLINKEIQMGKGKVAAQVAHAATMYTYTVLNNRKSQYGEEHPDLAGFLEWYSGIQKKIILKAPQEMLERLEAKGYITVRDCGYTQIPENTLTVVTLGVVSRDSVSNITTGLSLL